MTTIFKTFEQFVTDLEQPLNEAFKSTILKSIAGKKTKYANTIGQAMSKKFKIKMDQIEDSDILTINPADGKRMPYTKDNWLVIYYSTKQGLPIGFTIGGTPTELEKIDKAAWDNNRNNIRNNKVGFSEAADTAYAIDLSEVQAKYSNVDLKNQRVVNQQGTTSAIHDPRKINNLERNAERAKKSVDQYLLDIVNDKMRSANQAKYRKAMDEKVDPPALFELYRECVVLLSSKITQKVQALPSLPQLTVELDNVLNWDKYDKALILAFNQDTTFGSATRRLEDLHSIGKDIANKYADLMFRKDTPENRKRAADKIKKYIEAEGKEEISDEEIAKRVENYVNVEDSSLDWTMKEILKYREKLMNIKANIEKFS